MRILQLLPGSKLSHILCNSQSCQLSIFSLTLLLRPGAPSDSSIYEGLRDHPPPVAPPKPRRLSGSAPRELAPQNDDDVDYVPSSVRNRIAAFESGAVRPQVDDDVITASVDERRGVVRDVEPDEQAVVAKQQAYLDLVNQLDAFDERDHSVTSAEGSVTCRAPANRRTIMLFWFRFGVTPVTTR